MLKVLCNRNKFVQNYFMTTKVKRTEFILNRTLLYNYKCDIV